MGLLIHHPAPAFSLPDLDGRHHALHDYRGRTVILNFWSAECPWSARTDRDLTAALAGWNAPETAPSPRVVLLPIAANANEAPALLREPAAARGLPVVLHDADGQVAQRYTAQTTPHRYVIDPAGNLRYQGAADDVTFRQRTPTRHYLKDAVDALLRGDAPDPWSTPTYGCTLVSFVE
jgi:peroxiredoxin